MIPRELLGSAEIPGGGGALRLFRRASEYSIMLGATELMNSRMSGSEEALASLACARILPRPRPRMLIGGLGMGFTLRAALGCLPRDAEIVVAELVPEVVAWARGEMAEVFAGSLDDPRVRVVAADVAGPISDGGWDAILLDVDNGPDGLTVPANDRLYSAAGLATAKAALRPNGVLAVWSSAPDAAFTRRLRSAGFSVEEEAVRARGGKGGRHMIWLARPR
jgi:spermidine synthase